MDESKGQAILRILDLSDQLHATLRPVLPTNWGSFDLTMSQLKVVFLLYSQGPAHMSRLATALGVSLPTATGIVDRLVERGLVMREEYTSDRRLVVIRLSEHGEGLLLRVWETFKLGLTDLLGSAERSELDTLASALEVICRLAADRIHAAEDAARLAVEPGAG
jgi:DNA-binding MarR family transcriptional regulator